MQLRYVCMSHKHVNGFLLQFHTSFSIPSLVFTILMANYRNAIKGVESYFCGQVLCMKSSAVWKDAVE